MGCVPLCNTQIVDTWDKREGFALNKRMKADKRGMKKAEKSKKGGRKGKGGGVQKGGRKGGKRRVPLTV